MVMVGIGRFKLGAQRVSVEVDVEADIDFPKRASLSACLTRGWLAVLVHDLSLSLPLSLSPSLPFIFNVCASFNKGCTLVARWRRCARSGAER